MAAEGDPRIREIARRRGERVARFRARRREVVPHQRGTADCAKFCVPAWGCPTTDCEEFDGEITEPMWKALVPQARTTFALLEIIDP